jgi:hypothetical protein
VRIFRLACCSVFVEPSHLGEDHILLYYFTLIENVADVHIQSRTYDKKHKELTKAREDSKKKCGTTFKKMTTKWAESDKLVRANIALPFPVVSIY